MGSSLKGNISNNHINRGKPFALMLLLAFGAAILGVMILHKIREKRVFSVVVKHRDDQLLDLRLLYQREKEFGKEARKRIEEMKTKIYSLRSQKMELDRKLLEMESTITSLRDEREVIESAFDETRNEIKMLKEGRMESSSGLLLHEAEIEEMIKMKEDEIEDLKLQLDKSGNINSESNSVLHQNMHEHGNKKQENSGKDGVLVGTYVNTIEMLKIRENESTKAIDASGGARNHDSREQMDIHRGGPDVEKSYGFDSERGFGFRVRKKHIKGKKWKESSRSRKLGHQNTISGSQQKTGDGSQTRKKESSKEEKGQGQKIGLGSDGIQARDDDDDDENYRPMLVSDGLKKKGEEIISNRTQSHETSGKLEMMNDTDVDKSGNGNEKQEVAEKEEAATEDLEDAETHEPEIDKADIQRFSESEETEETEF